MAGIGGFTTRINGTATLTSTALEVSSIAMPELGETDIDVSSMDSVSNYMEFVPGSVDPGVIDVTFNYNPTIDAELLASVAQAVETFTILFPDASTWATKGYVNKMGGGTAGTNDKIDRVLSIKCTGLPTHTTGA
jgi:hypothetical protein